ncbi:VCBS repeat-containing protein [Streptomyces sp. TBY4]|uniref:FG-GAP repeat domain-containing protein n=1 Tax=Streptomyces sp. TBY4 TaxID=2962030 RepID=UPI0020B72970|nr:VCBS repeat-containing protein [Streptomyces sp. TBY4]MCP3754194.1 VCBS repeat-containing protein [Streptomyces sp. TBY4]
MSAHPPTTRAQTTSTSTSTATTTAPRRSRSPRRTRATALAALGTLLCAVAGILTAFPATAAVPHVADASIATHNVITRTATTGMGLKDLSRTDESRVDAYPATHPGVTRATLSDVLADTANTTPARPLCHTTHIDGAQGFCWSEPDDATTQWYPQGVTHGTVGSRKAVLTSWYGPGGTERISVADATNPSAVRYRNVQLVALTADGSGYTAIRDGHANGVVWAGTRLYVASIGSSLDVFDTTRIWRTDSGTYVLPRVGSYAYTGAGTGCGTYAPASLPQRPCISALSLDLSGADPALVTAEMDPGNVGDRFDRSASPVVRWPIDPTTGVLKATAGVVPARDAYRSPIGGIQGVAMNNGRFVLSAPCPEYVDGGATHLPSCLYQGAPDEPVWLMTRTGIYTQNLSYRPDTGELWMVNERPGDRMAYRTTWPAAPTPAGMVHLTAADFTGEGRADVVGVEAATGKLWLYPGNGDGSLGARTQIGVGWGTMAKLAAGDLTGDGKADLIAVEKATGTLQLYPGNGQGTLGARSQIGTAWGGKRDLTVIDFDRNGRPDLLAITPEGALMAHPGNGNGTLAPPSPIGSGWDTMNELTAPGDMTGDGRADLVAVDRQGLLWAYPGNGTGGFGDRTQMGSSWQVMRQLAGADFNADGKGDIITVQATATTGGPLYLYPGTATTTLGPRIQIGSNW